MQDIGFAQAICGPVSCAARCADFCSLDASWLHPHYSPARTDAETRAELGRAAAFLKSGLAPLRPHPGTSGNGRPARHGQDDRLEEAETFLEAGVRRVERLAQQLAAHYEQAPTAQERSI